MGVILRVRPIHFNLAAILGQAMSFDQFTSFAASNRSVAADLADRFGRTSINVKDDYGARGDGSSDDTAPLQAALNDAFGTGTGTISLTSQRRVIIPPGKYIVRGGGLTGKNWDGGCISGSGRFATTIQNADGGPVLTTNGCEYMRFEDMNLDGNNGSNPIFDLDWASGTGTACQSNTFFNMYFSDGGVGLRIANSGGGAQGSETLILNSFFGNCSTAGIQNNGTNALQQTMVGGNIQNCGKGIQVQLGSFNTVHGVGFQLSSTADISIENNSQNTMSVLGCRTESPNFISNAAGQNVQVSACHQTSASGRGIFYSGNGGMVHISACLFDGQVNPTGWSRICIQACQPYREAVAGDWLLKNVGSWWYTPNNSIPLSIEVENVESFLAAGGALGAIIGKQRIFTTDGATVTTQNYTVA